MGELRDLEGLPPTNDQPKVPRCSKATREGKRAARVRKEEWIFVRSNQDVWLELVYLAVALNFKNKQNTRAKYSL